ncbi:hypothetical protein [Gimesia algae]|uniref:Uncharacterized protein n=1 Tax=Gimesia algae TaxID=2527971 RepID=A0A517VEQ4_9PLAN|nr:hypothetical protein [Gimesia algae]QDT91476.1 hypothetical protein Pan161_31340 [Gimesia algae]
MTTAPLIVYNSVMLKPRLTEEQRNALDQQHGLVEVDEEGRKYILMSIEIYRDMLGVGTDEELAASLNALNKGLADVDAGRTRPFRDVLAELDDA